VDLGPVEYVIIGFPTSDLCGRIAPAVADLVLNDTVRVLDLVFIAKDPDGAVSVVEFDELVDALEFAEIDGEVGGVLSDDDTLAAAEDLEPGSSALFIVWEDRWALPFAQAVRDAGGMIVAGERIPNDIVEAAFAGID
jgi:uncharacterized membrane protein